MKRISILCFALLAGLCITAQAAGKKTSKKKGKAVEQVKVDTVSVDTFSYAYGKANTQGLKLYLSQRMGIDTTYMDDFMKGFEQMALTETDKKEKARLAGIEIRAQLENQILPAANRQIDDSVQVLVKQRFVDGFKDGIMQANMYITMDSTQKLVRKQMDYYHNVKMEKKYGANRLAGEEFLKLNAKKDSVQTTPSGLQYKVITMGTGEKPQPTQKVKVNYEGRLIDGTVFDSSFKHGKPVTFPCNQVIKGWTEALCMMPVGSKWELYVPQQLAYGDREQGKIPPFSTLVFTVELLSIEK
ncbi:MAG: FKBP-type peptidyl-prolyl cis-trans isomerase [Prevotellaceae bacterium]|nr:FKBP-type peptidyl-prolyl cis-trans isomerase [Prevotellaceae bacterium]MDY6098546.1 FKBP-type peptidyl-prolyl cis-trans isomerase [Bacteroidaceae bacterium]